MKFSFTRNKIINLSFLKTTKFFFYLTVINDDPGMISLI